MDLINVILSSNPCPKCVEASASPAKSMEAWQSSMWGLPGSSGRYCEDDCHCILFPVDKMPEFPAIGEKVLLKGDKGTDILATVAIHPNEIELKVLMEKYNAMIGKLPKEIYDMSVAEIIPYLKNLMKKQLSDAEWADVLAAIKKAIGEKG